MVDMTMQIGSE